MIFIKRVIHYRLVLTNSPYLLKLSAINFISCILLKANLYEDNIRFPFKIVSFSKKICALLVKWDLLIQ